MKTFFCLVLAIMVFTVTDVSAAGNSQAPTDPAVKNFSSHFPNFYDLAPERRGMMPIGLVDQAGKKVSLKDYEGRFVVLHFWATWCPPCLKELPTIQAFHDTQGGKGPIVLTVSLDYDIQQNKLDNFMKKINVSLPILRVPKDDPSWNELTGFALPVTFIISPKGQVLYKMIGENNWANNDTKAFFNALMTRQKK